MIGSKPHSAVLDGSHSNFLWCGFVKLILMEKQDFGLTSNEVTESLKRWGQNVIDDPDKVNAVKIVLRQLKNNFMIYLLLLAAITSFFIGEKITGYTVIGVIVMVIGVGFFQEYRAEKAIAALCDLITQVSTVIRDGKEQQIATAQIVPGDILVLRTGEKVPADSVILHASNFEVNEAVLTGEAAAINRKTDDTIFAGTFAVRGKCVAKVTATGMNTKFGQIVKMISRSEKELPLMKKINTIARYMVIAAIVVSFATGLLMVFRAETITNLVVIKALIVVIALMVSAFPEGLPVVLITSLAVGVSRMAKNNAIVNRMSIIETLGETTVICSDKTGTITTGQMMVEKIQMDGDHDQTLLLKAAILCNDAKITRDDSGKGFHIFGSPTEGALLVKAAEQGMFREDFNFVVREEIPFSSERKMMSVLGDLNAKTYVFAKGAPETILSKCDMSEAAKKQVLAQNQTLTKGAYRTLAVAYKLESKDTLNLAEESLIFLGLVAISDPPREEISGSIKMCQAAGITVKMITGDHGDTALAVADKIGLKGKILTGDDLDKLSDGQLKSEISECNIFVRVRPEHKLRIVQVLKSLGEVVTMTGDGVNDAPALKAADIGVAMGKNGTDVSRSVADLTLKDDNFATIVMAIKEGRMIFNNMRKFVSYQLSCNYAELMILFFGVLLAPIFTWQTPILLALQILFMNLVTDDLPAITFAFNKASSDVMEELPRKRPEVMTKSLVILSLVAGGLMTIITLFSFYVSSNLLHQPVEVARTTALVCLILLELINAFNFRSFRWRTLNRSFLSNHYLFFASVLSLVFSLVLIYSPLNFAFGLVPIGLTNWLVPIVLTISFISLFDVLKILNTRRKLLNFA